MTNYLELAQLPDGSIVLRRSDDKENPIVKIEFSKESKDFLRGQELDVAKEMIRAGIESVSGNVFGFYQRGESVSPVTATSASASLWLPAPSS